MNNKSIIIHGVQMPQPTQDGLDTFLDVRIYSDGKVQIPCAAGIVGATVTAEEVDE